MSDTKIPRMVPLPEVGNYTEEIAFGNLGLPVGFDSERVLVNVRGINRIRTAAGLGHIGVVGERGDISSYDYQITGMHGGSATMASAAKQPNISTARGSVTYPTGSSFYFNPDTIIRLNTSEIEERIKAKHGTIGVYEVAPRAKELNKAVKHGLVQASIDANMDKDKLRLTATYYAGFTGMGVALGVPPTRALLIPLVFGPLLFNMNALKQISMYEKNPWQSMRELRQSLFVGIALDRMVAGAGLAKTTRLIKARS